jgi:hypothetical protein
MSIPFICSPNTTSIDQCYHGLFTPSQINNQIINQTTTTTPSYYTSNCIQTPTQGFTCICDPGGPWQHDMIWAHIPNCMMPQNLPLAMFIITSILSLILLPLFIQLNLRSSAREIKFCSIMALIDGPLVTLTIYLQNGTFEATLILTGIIESIVVIIGAYLTLMFFKPLLLLSSINPDNFIQRLRIFKYLSVTLIIILKLIQIPFAQDDNPSKFNAAWVSALFITSAIFSCFAISILYIANQLKYSLKDSVLNIQNQVEESATVKQMDVIKRLETLQLAVFASFLSTDCTLLIVGIVFVSLGYFPMVGVVYYAIILASYLSLAILRLSLKSQVVKTSNNNNNTTPARSSKIDNNKVETMAAGVIVGSST